MPISFRQVGPCFAAEVNGIDMRKPLTPAEVAAIHAGMDKYAVLVFRDQHDRRRAAARLHPEPGRDRARDRHQPARGQRVPPADDLRRRLQPRQGQQAVRARRPAAAVRHRQPAVALRQLVQGRCRPSTRCCTRVSIPSKGGNTEFADMRAAYDALDDETKAEVEDLVCEHSQMYSRAACIGFTDFTDEERERFKPVRQCLVRTHPVDGPQVALPVLPCRHASSAGRCPRRAASCAT